MFPDGLFLAPAELCDSNVLEQVVSSISGRVGGGGALGGLGGGGQ